MIKMFNKEEFFSQPASVQTYEEVSYAQDALGNTAIASPHERTIIINVGGEDYDIRELVWRLKCAEANIDQLCARLCELDYYCHGLESRLGQLEQRVF